jgi:DNA repair protein RecN (Recombination protein N)
MLVGLSVRDVVLIDRLDLSFESGLCVLTGETGAGKSILLDALGLALGNRADTGLLRPDAKQASVTAAFEVGSGHPARAILDEGEIEAEDDACSAPTGAAGPSSTTSRSRSACCAGSATP